MILEIFKQYYLRWCSNTEHHRRCDAVAGTRQWSHSVQQLFLLFDTALKQLYKLYLGLVVDCHFFFKKDYITLFHHLLFICLHWQK